MGARDALRFERPAGQPFDLDRADDFARWREWKLGHAARSVDELMVEVGDPAHLSGGERQALLQRLAMHNMALYRSARTEADPGLPLALGAQLGLRRLDTNWLAHEDGISHIAVSDQRDERGGFIPYTDRAIRWHTDGYYHPDERLIRGMILHAVRDAAHGGDNRLADHEMLYLHLRDRSPDLVRALMDPCAMTIPAREDERGIARPAQTGPVFSVDPQGRLHLRYTARTRSIAWKDDAATQAAVQAIEELLEQPWPWVLQARLTPGTGLVCHNVLHDRSAFVDDARYPRLLYRARFLDRADEPEGPTWRSG